MTKINCFIDANDHIEEKFFLYADPEIGLYVHAKEKSDIEDDIERRNLFFKKLTEKAKQEQKQKTTDTDKENPDDFNLDELIPEVDIDKITEEQAKSNSSLEVKEGVINIVYNEDNLTEFEIEIKQPNTQDILSMQQSSMISINGKPTLDENLYRHVRLVNLLKDWNIQKSQKDGTLKKVPVNEQNIGKLHPKVYNAIMFYIDANIDLHLDNLV